MHAESVEKTTARSTKSRVNHARSLPHCGPFNVAAAFSVVHYLSLAVTATALVLTITDPSALARSVFFVGIAISLVTWLVSFLKRRCAHCPLCKGTPMVNSGAYPHSRASRIFPLNHGVSATLAIITTQTFRCMYCGSDFDMLKPPSRRQNDLIADPEVVLRTTSARHAAWPSSTRLPAPVPSISRFRK